MCSILNPPPPILTPLPPFFSYNCFFSNRILFAYFYFFAKCCPSFSFFQLILFSVNAKKLCLFSVFVTSQLLLDFFVVLVYIYCLYGTGEVYNGKATK